MRTIERVVLHCAATPDYPEPSSKFDLFGAADIDVWHKQRGFSGIGYHYVIRRTGEIELGRPVGEVGAHVKGANTGSIGVCYIGTRTPTPAQVESLVQLAIQFRSEYRLNAVDWYGHYEFNRDKICPGFPMHMMRTLLACRLSHQS